MTPRPVPLVDLRAQMAELSPDVEHDVLSVLSTAGFIGGSQVESFEREYAAFSQVNHCVGLANGTDAVELALRALGVTSKHEVIVPANTFVATAEAVARIGATLVLVDVLPDTLLMDPALVPGAITDRTKVVVPVHLYGQLADVDRIRAAVGGSDVAVLEDAAQSHGASDGTRVSGGFGDAAATSFYPGKNLGAAGDAGAVTTPDADVAQRVRLLSNHGSPSKYLHEVVGYNSRLDAIQAVVLRHKLRRLAAWNARRSELAERYTRLLADVPDVQTPTCAKPSAHVWHLYVVEVPERDGVLKLLHGTGVGAAIHYPVPVHLTPAFGDRGYGPGDFPVSERAAGRILSLPIYPHLTDELQDRVVDAVTAAMTGAC